TIGATSPQTFGGAKYTFSSWSDGGAISHTITVPSTNTTYTATFISPTVPPPPPPPPPTSPPAVRVGVADFATGPDQGGGGTVRFFNPDSTEKFNVSPFDSTFTGGMRVAVADFNGDGVPDLAVGTGPGSAAHVRVLDGQTHSELFAVDPFEVG